MATEMGVAGARISNRKPLMLYVNVPFCRSKCAFCDHVQPIPVADLLLTSCDDERQQYIAALCNEIIARGAEVRSRFEPTVMYWGGGTASILEPSEIDRIITALRQSFDLSQLKEATIECSPDTVDHAKLARFRELGFNRVSSGVQSFDDDRLRRLGRRHDATEARAVVRRAREAGFDNINIDIMCGFPDETLAEVRYTVTEALRLDVDHISLYPFRPTPGTGLRVLIDRGRSDLHLANQKIAFAQARSAITSAGYDEYASGYFGIPSIFAVEYFQMRTPLLGFGSGAMSVFDQRFRSHLKGALRSYSADPIRYDVDVPAGSDPVVLSSLRAGLSCFDGVLRAEWAEATGTELNDVLSRPVFASFVRFLRERGLVEDERGIRLPPSQVGNVLIDLAFHVIGAANSAAPGEKTASAIAAAAR